MEGEARWLAQGHGVLLAEQGNEPAVPPLCLLPLKTIPAPKINSPTSFPTKPFCASARNSELHHLCKIPCALLKPQEHEPHLGLLIKCSIKILAFSREKQEEEPKLRLVLLGFQQHRAFAAWLIIQTCPGASLEKE